MDKGKMAEIAEEILSFTKTKIMMHMRFMDTAISKLRFSQYDGTLAVNGRNFMYSPPAVIRLYKKSPEHCTHGYMHMVLHCVFQHFCVGVKINQEYWNLACDMAVEAMIDDLNLDFLRCGDQQNKRNILESVKKRAGVLTAEKIYHCLMHSKSDDVGKWAETFYVDDHSVWYRRSGENSSNTDDISPDSDSNNNNADHSRDSEDISKLAQEWKEISEKMKMDLESFYDIGKIPGILSGSLMMNLIISNRKKYDYASFLKKFAVSGETMTVNDDEFDYIFYSYGLQNYKNALLIEPLEYKDVIRVKDFVIAIDTSGSCSGKLVKAFLNQTYAVLKSSESFFKKFNIHIVQCDASVQMDTKITSQREFDDYINNIKLFGFGGTDFRPVFQYVDTLIKKKEFTDLKGMIYFTDGFGIYPASKPEYKTAFVFLDSNYNNYSVPSWAIKIIIEKEVLENEYKRS